MFPRKRVSSNNNSSKGESGTREERLPGLHQTHAKCEPSSRMLGKKTRLRPRVQGASPCLGRRGPGAQQAGPGAQRCPCSESLFPAGIGEHRAGRHRQEAGSSAGATAGTAGRQDRAAQQPAPGARGQQGQPSGLDPGPATRPPAWVPAQNTQGGCAPRATAGTDEPTAGNSTTWRPRRPGPRVPGETRSQARRQAVPEIRVAGAPRGPPRPPPPPRAVHPGRARAAQRPLRQLHTQPGPRSPLTEAAAAPGRRSASLPPSRVSRALRPREATGGAHGRAGAGSSSACAAIAVASRVRGSAAMSARLTLSASLAARPPQPRSSLRRRIRGGRVPPLAAPRHSALQPSFLTLFCPSLPLSPRLFAHPAARWSWGAYPAPAGLLSGAPGGVPGAARP